MRIVLIVEDHADTAALLERILRHDGLDAVAVSTGAEALRLLGVRVPAIVVLDCHLPDMSGVDVLRAIRSGPDTASLPVVIYTSDDSSQCRREVERLGADE